MVILSIHEFHPQWLINPPVAGCASISNCGAHSLTTNPVSSILSSNPSGNSTLLTSPSKISPLSASRRTQINFSRISSSDNEVVVPNET
ncbi:hypothetical protein LXL04_000357 [Taraxacum kok-saghyz]